MRLLLIATLLSLSCCNPVFAQRESYGDVPALLQKLSATTSDTARIMIKCRLGEAYRSNAPDTSFLLATEALTKSKEISFEKGEVHALVLLCVMYREKGELPYALELGLEALRIAEKEKLSYEQVYALIRVAVVYISVRDAEKATTYLKRADKVLKENYDVYQWVVVQYFLGVVYEQTNDLDAAEKQIKLYELKLQEFPDWFLVTSRLRANIAVKRNQLPLAIQYYRQSYAAGIAESANRETATTCNAMAAVFKKLGQVDSAIYYAKEGLRLGQELDYRNRILAASSLLAEIYAESDPKEAVKYFQMASAMKDSLYGVQKVLQLQSSTMKEQERQTELEAARLAYQNKMKQWVMLGGIAVVVIVALILYRNNRQKHRTNKVLERTLTDLRTTQSQLVQSEKMASLGELTAGIAHEIQNPLNFVNNFSEVNDELLKELRAEAEKGNLDEVKAIAKDIEFNSEKINHHGKRADSIVKGMLQHSRTSNGQKESTDINALCDDYLRLAYHGLRAKDKSFNATTKTDFDNSIGKINVVPQDLGRVILNLINNAFYAVNEKQKQSPHPLKGGIEPYQPIVTISTKRLGSPPSGGDGGKPGSYRVEIRVADNGNGIPQKILDKIFQPFFTTKPTGQGTGLGLSLAYDLITKGHGGKLKVETKEGEGSGFIIQLPAN
ncbi:MAG TPA: ATP-binding protein [Chitinophagaceae bacterium]